MADVTINQLSPGSPNKDSAVIPYSDGSTTLKTSPSGIVAASPGCLLQVVQAYKTDLWETTTINTWQDVPGLSVTMNLKSPTSKILVNTNVSVGRTNFNGGNDVNVRLVRNESVVGGSTLNNGGVVGGIFGQSAGQPYVNAQSYSLNTMFLDTPIVLANTYKIQFWLGAGGTGRVNCRGCCLDFITTSHLTLQEIAG